MNYEDKVTDIYVTIDDFYKEFAPIIEKHSLNPDQDGKKRRKRASRLSPSEVMTILVLFHLGRIQVSKTLLPELCLQAYDK